MASTEQKKFFLLKVLFVLISIESIAQQTIKKERDTSEYKKYDFIRAIVGGAIPLADFANDDVTGSGNGLAENGYFMSVGFGSMPKKMIGYEFSVSSFFNPLNRNVDIFLNKHNYPSNYDYRFDYGSWMTFTFMVGPRFNIDTRKFSLALTAQGGFLDSRKPQIKQEFYDNGTLVFSVNSKSGNGSAFGYQLGCNLIHHLNKNVQLVFSAEYIAGSPKIKYFYTMKDHNSFVNFSGEYKQKIALCNLGLGIVYRLKDYKSNK